MTVGVSPVSAASGAVGASADRLAGLLLMGLLGCTLFLQKFSIAVGGGEALPLVLFLMLGFLGVGVISGRLILHPVRAIWFFIFAAALIASQLLGSREFSIPALSLVLLIHLFYIVTLRPGALRPGVELEFYQKACAVIAVLALLQFFGQFVIGWQWAYFLDSRTYPPYFFILTAPVMNNLIPLSSGGEIFKSNGFFLNEPSILCQFLAIAVVVELAYFRHRLRLLLLAGGIAVSFSGTGLLVLFALVPFFLLQQRQFLVLAALAVAALLAPLWAPFVGLDHTLDRLAEFSNPHTSAHARFISPLWQVRDFVFPSLEATLFGNGAGSIGTITAQAADYKTWDPTWVKLIFEYGLLGVLAYLPFVLSLFISSPRSGYLKAGLAVTFFIMGGNLATPYTHILLLALLAWPAAGDGDYTKARQPPKVVS